MSLTLAVWVLTVLCGGASCREKDVKEPGSSTSEWDYVHVSKPGMQHAPVPPRKLAIWTDFIKNTMSTLRRFGGHDLPVSPEKVAIIIEPRNNVDVLQVFEYAVRNIMHFLGDGHGWGLQVFCSRTNIAQVQTVLHDFKDIILTLVDEIDYVGPSWDFTPNSAWLQYFMISEGFWQAVVGKKVLVFQTDTLLCRHSYGLRDFIDFDYIGAPWSGGILATNNNGRGGYAGNGGLSIRNVTLMLECTRSSMFRDRLITRHRARKYLSNEDLLFGMCLLSHPQAKLPSREEAMRFSVETLYFDRPLGFHAIWRHLEEDQIQHIFDTIQYTFHLEL